MDEIEKPRQKKEISKLVDGSLNQLRRGLPVRGEMPEIGEVLIEPRESDPVETSTIKSRVNMAISQKAISYRKIEEALGFANGTIGKFEKNIPSALKIKKIAEYLNVSTDYLLGLSNCPNRYENLKRIMQQLKPEQQRQIHKQAQDLLKELPKQGQVVSVDGKEFIVTGTDENGQLILKRKKPDYV
jgi:transcriptional regulator with XRE-family HTH domain